MKLFNLNGWWRLYITFIACWLLATCTSYYYSLPEFDQDPEQIASFEIREHIMYVQSMRDPLSQHQEADRLCEAAYAASNQRQNKNECMSFLITPKEVSATAHPFIRIAIEKPMLSKKTMEAKERIWEEKKPLIIHESIRHARIATIVPLLVLAMGYATAWIRKGFNR